MECENCGNKSRKSTNNVYCTICGGLNKVKDTTNIQNIQSSNDGNTDTFRTNNHIFNNITLTNNGPNLLINNDNMDQLNDIFGPDFLNKTSIS